MAGPRRIVVLTDFLPPDFGATGQYALRDAREWAEQGHHVTLAGMTTGAGGVEHEGDLAVIRLRVRDRPLRPARRAAWTLWTEARLMWRLRAALAGADELVYGAGLPYLELFVVPLGLLGRRRLRQRLTDLHPECLMATLGVEVGEPLALRALHGLTRALRRRVDVLEVGGEDQRRRLLEQGIPAERVQVRRDGAPITITSDTPPLERPAALAGRKILLYSGNLGVAHDADTLLRAYLRHHREGSGRVGLWLNARGEGADRIERACRAAGVPIHRSQPVPLALLPRLLTTPDAHLVTLRDRFVGYVHPSKVYGAVASGRPIIYVGSERADVHALCTHALPAGSYRRVSVGDVVGLADAFEEVA